MKAVIKLHLKENIKKNSFIIFAILGTIVSLIVLFELEFSVNGMKSTSDYAIYGIQWRILSIIACLAGVTLSMNVIANHRQGTKRELLKLHGLPVYKQYLSLICGIFYARNNNYDFCYCYWHNHGISFRPNSS